MTYSFSTQLAIGQVSEREFAKLLRKHKYRVRSASRTQQRQGIDLIVVSPTGEKWAIEVKTDQKAHRTGNAFIETCSVDSRAVGGWALRSKSRLAFVLLPRTASALHCAALGT